MSDRRARVEDGGRPVVITEREAKRLQGIAAMLGKKRYGSDAELVLELVNRYAGAERLVAVDQAALVGLRDPCESSARTHERVYVLSPSKEQTQLFAWRWVTDGPGRRFVDVVDVWDVSTSELPAGTVVIELPGASELGSYERLRQRLSILGLRIVPVELMASRARTGGTEAEQPADAAQAEPATGTLTPGVEVPSGDAAAAGREAASEEGHSEQAGAAEGAAPATTSEGGRG